MTPTYKTEQEVFDELKLALSSGKPSKKLLTYLDDFAHDRLTTGRIDRPQGFYWQLLGARTAIYQKLNTGNGRRQIIRQGDMPTNIDVHNFFSIIGVLCYVLHEIELTNNIGYQPLQVEDGVKAIKVAYAEIVVSDELADKLDVPPVQPVRPVTATVALVDDRTIYAMLDDGRKFRLSRRLTIGAQPHSFIQHMRANPLTSLGRGDIEIATGSRDITDLVHRCGFDEKIKPIFFPNTNEQTVYFRPSVTNLTPEQVEALEKHRWQ
jgi:hypothetical protein